MSTISALFVYLIRASSASFVMSQRSSNPQIRVLGDHGLALTRNIRFSIASPSLLITRIASRKPVSQDFAVVFLISSHFSFPGEREVGCFHVFFQMGRYRGGSGDWKNYGTAVQQPSYRELRDGSSVAFRNFVQLAPRAREITCCDREPGDEGDVVAFAVFKNIFMLAVAKVV